MSDKNRVIAILKRNRDKRFVRRILNPSKFPVVDNDDGSKSTHLMATSEMDGKHYAYPTLLYASDGKLYQYDDPFGKAMEYGQFIEFDSAEDADWFAKHYKLGWGK